eukprot:Plantae.Rhodophyta-Purpureofilum_apyrenoidigerum.ctg24013.p1 GENE.Plantae.Rhodophyta-Purpureofilum_apyrenoidigerum.ctg24013~~Plantae.Rhodophyta-Purpureofilum_apyrenoidigerum.ctg24013.p1  ORF type:complete len:402 (+),score=44.58 Plantae.Rhodophyta-Purpureofilum_apyrenoidigerum.ctg24013:112-1317(+)
MRSPSNRMDISTCGEAEEELRLLQLPDDVLVLILSRLRPNQLICEHRWQLTRCERCDWINDCAVALTCRKLQRLAQREELWMRLVAKTYTTYFALYSSEIAVRRAAIDCPEQLLVNCPPKHGEQLMSWIEVYRRLAMNTIPTALEYHSPISHGDSWEVDRSTGLVRWRSNRKLGKDRAIRSLRPFNLREMMAPGGSSSPYEEVLSGAMVFRSHLGRDGCVHYKIVNSNVYYYEVTVVGPEDALRSDGDVLPCICIGLTTDDESSLGEQPGWSTSSYGIHSDDGGVFNGLSKYTANHFGVGDTIGCGIRFQPGDSDSTKFQIFFTKNGQFLCMAFPREADNKIAVVTPSKFYYPVVGVDAYHIAFRPNFGQAPFLYDLDTLDGSLLPNYNAIRRSWQASRQT